MLTRKAIEEVGYGITMATKRIYTYAVPIMTKAAKLFALLRNDCAFELGIGDEPPIKVYEVFEDDFCTCAVFAHVEWIAKY